MTVGDERLLTSTTVIFVLVQLNQHPLIGQALTAPPGGATRAGGGDQMLENTTTWFPSRNIEPGQPSISSLPASARSCGGQLVTVKRFRPESTKMRVPSFLTKSASSTPATCTLVVLKLAGAAEAPGAAPAAAGPAIGGGCDFQASICERICLTAVSWTVCVNDSQVAAGASETSARMPAGAAGPASLRCPQPAISIATTIEQSTRID